MTEQTKCRLSNKSLEMCLPDQHAWAYCVSSPGDKTVREKACSTLQTRGGKSAFGHDYGSW